MKEIPTLLIISGIVLIIIGIVWFFGSKYLPLGKLPGDFSYQSKNMKIYFPLATSIIISIILTLILWSIRYFKQ